MSHGLGRAKKQLLLVRSFARRREEVKESVLTFGGDSSGSFTMPWKLNTVCDIYSLVECSHCIEMDGNKHEWNQLEELFFTFNRSALSANVN